MYRNACVCISIYVYIISLHSQGITVGGEEYMCSSPQSYLKFILHVSNGLSLWHMDKCFVDSVFLIW